MTVNATLLQTTSQTAPCTRQQVQSSTCFELQAVHLLQV
jgi:hypothetical protein